MSSTGTTTLRSHSFVRRRGHHLDRARRRRGTGPPPRPAARSRDSPIRWAGPLEQLVEPLEGDREVGAALGAGHGVHLVDDHRLDAAQRLAGLAR